jgi:hypothetical protein
MALSASGGPTNRAIPPLRVIMWCEVSPIRLANCNPVIAQAKLDAVEFGIHVEVLPRPVEAQNRSS